MLGNTCTDTQKYSHILFSCFLSVSKMLRVGMEAFELGTVTLLINKLLIMFLSNLSNFPNKHFSDHASSSINGMLNLKKRKIFA